MCTIEIYLALWTVPTIWAKQEVLKGVQPDNYAMNLLFFTSAQNNSVN